ncbi:DUF3572 domain-containing protein [Rhizorhabdus dicambivorans]|uniref:DUF3572 domain-containing protein n=1 Tax=Rhizorhabdus dicambivorans TaxID=1850238 RepID=A0A2A4G0F2_9SPHN|nr:DUF3572 domain-containing protein [Rhizorhabdus dicambivorans]ATE63257.1 DUF3572 domain-containing protein [Rhizorhabdus dicambivorans]PCE43471.1 DUF3572 domain-containing protein [Rhizorhabdus dicambivorans]
MPPGESNPANLRGVQQESSIVTGLTALAWTLADPARAQRLLDLTGLTPEALRAGAGDASVLAALLDFLAGHEPDLIACAEAIGLAPTELVRARDVLQPDRGAA